MYTEFYGLKQEPFRLTPDPEFYFLGEIHNKSLAHLLYGINNKKGFIALTGEVGAGKTTLCRLLLKQLDDNTSVAIILNSLVDEITFLKQINRDFAIPYETDSHDDLVGYLYDFLISEKRKNKNVVVIVDECQNLKFEVLEQIRMLSNLETEKDKLIQILLIGQPEFIDMLNSYELRQLNQRITVRAHISALSPQELEKYLYHRLKIAGNEFAVKFTKGAIKKIYNYSKGIPRKVNVIADYSLLAGYVENSRKITTDIVTKALKDIEVKRELNVNDSLNKIASINILKKLLLTAAMFFVIAFFFQDQLMNAFANFGGLFDIKAKSLNLKNLSLPKKTKVSKKSIQNNLSPIITPKQKITKTDSNNKTQINKVSNNAQKIIKEENKTQHNIENETKKENKIKNTSQPTQNNSDKKIKNTDTNSNAVNTKKQNKPKIKKQPFDKTTKKSSLKSLNFFETLKNKEKGLWLLLSTWGIEIAHERRSETGIIIPIHKQLKRYNYTLFSTWADINLLKDINIPCSVEIIQNGKTHYWVLNAIKDNFVRLYTAPDKIKIMEIDNFLKIWQGNAHLIVERGYNTLEGNSAIYKGMRGNIIIQLKKILIRLGMLENKKVTNLFDLNTERKIKEFQKTYNLTADGIVGVETKLLFYSILSKYIPRLLEKK